MSLFKCSHDTLEESSPDLLGNSYKLSVDTGFLSNSKQGDSCCTFEARLRSEHGIHDPKNQKIVITRFRKQLQSFDGNKTWSEEMINKATVARSLAQKFNSFLSCAAEPTVRLESQKDQCLDGKQCKDGRLTFLIPQRSKLASASFLGKTRKEGEWFVFEDKQKSHQTFVTKNGVAAEECAGEKRSILPLRSKAKLSKKMSISRKNSTKCESSSFEDFDQRLSGNILQQSGLYPNLTCLDDHCDPPPSYMESEALYGFPCTTVSDFQNFLDSCPHYTTTTDVKHPLSRSRSSSTISNGESEVELDHVYLQAFIHHAFCNSNGKHIICNLKGSRDKKDGSYTLSTPTIHSIDQSMGCDDLGISGMFDVIANHRCSRLCRHLPDMAGLLSQSIS